MSGIRVCIDTNVFLNVLNREREFYEESKEVLNAVDRGTLKTVIPTLVISEILTGFYMEKKDNEAGEFLSAVLTKDMVSVVQLSVDIAVSSAVIRARTGMRLPDSMVLATALHEKVDYMVTNDGNFPDSLDGLHSITSTELAKLL